VPQQYLPDDAAGRFVFRPGDTGEEAALAGRLVEIDERMGRRGRI
jgi:hypothetical protein